MSPRLLAPAALAGLLLAPFAAAEPAPPPPDPRVQAVAARLLLEANQSDSFRTRSAVTALARRGYLEEMARQAIDELDKLAPPPTDPTPPPHEDKARAAARDWAKASLSYDQELPRSSYTQPRRFRHHPPILAKQAIPMVRPPRSHEGGAPPAWIVELPVRTFFTKERKPYDTFLIRVNAESFLVEGVRGNFKHRSDREWGEFAD
jgi:hypothetical protein